jgi:hypothetical protein
MAQRLYTWFVPVAPCALEQVRAALSHIHANPAANALLPFGRLPMVHFASLTLFDQDPAESPALALESNIDGSLRKYVSRLVVVGRRGLDALFVCADGYPAPADADAKVVDYLLRTKKRPQLYHLGHPDRSLDEIRGDHELRRSIVEELRADGELRRQSPADIVEAIRHRANCPTLARPLLRPWHPNWAEPPTKESTPLQEIQWRRDASAWRRTLRAIALISIACLTELAFVMLLGHHLWLPKQQTMFVASLIIAGLVAMSSSDARRLRGVLSAAFIAFLVEMLLRALKLDPLSESRTSVLVFFWIVAAPVLVLGASYGIIALRLKVTRPFPAFDAKQRQHVRDLEEAEDRTEHSIYNHVAGLSLLRSDMRRLRWLRTRLALTFLNLFYRTYFVKGKLVSIPSIHFAQWSLLDDRRLLFLTNYDGSADRYLDDFFNSLAIGVAFIWYDTTIFPRTTDPRLLKLWVRAGQTLASVRYRAPVYDGLSVGVINNNTFIRTRLLRGRGQQSARRWLRRLATNPVEPTVLSRFAGWLKGLAGVTE